LNLLWKVDLLTCVSGGSIAGAFLAANWGKPDTLDRLEQYLRTKSIAAASVIGGILDPFESRLHKLEQSYDRDLFKGATLNALSTGPRIYINATNLSTGNLFFFVAGEGKPTEMGEHELGVVEAGSFPICRAVAASSAFPPVFPPLRLDSSTYSCADVEYVTLTDGGVYDNLGVNPILRTRNELDYVIVSDGGKPFAIDDRPTESGSLVVVQSVGILMEQVRGLQFRRLQLSAMAKTGPKPLWFSIDSHVGEKQPGDAAFASAIGTNLKKLSAAEMDVLTRHGGGLLHHRVTTYSNELIATT
jgi:NTE family protein